MEPETSEPHDIKQNKLNTVTPLSKYLTMILFVLAPFIGGLVGYNYALEKVVGVGKHTVKKETVEISEDTKFEKSVPEEEFQNIENLQTSYLYEDGNIRLEFSSDEVPFSVKRSSGVPMAFSVKSLDDSDDAFYLVVVDYCYEKLCNADVLNTFNTMKETWNYLAPHTYTADMNLTGHIPLAYSLVKGGYTLYLMPSNILSAETNNLFELFQSIQFDVKNIAQ